MIKFDKQTKKELIVVTSSDCHFCRMLHESGKCEGIALSRTLVLAEYSNKDRLVNKLIFKAHDPKGAFKKLLMGEELEDSDIDYSKDVSKQCEQNSNMFNMLQSKFNVQGTPSFFIKDGESITPIEPPQPDMAQVLFDSIKAYM